MKEIDIGEIEVTKNQLKNLPTLDIPAISGVNVYGKRFVVVAKHDLDSKDIESIKDKIHALPENDIRKDARSAQWEKIKVKLGIDKLTPDEFDIFREKMIMG